MQGNIVLTDSKYQILTLLRSHRDDEKGFALMARYPYPMHAVRLRRAVSDADLDAALISVEDKTNLKGTCMQLVTYF